MATLDSARADAGGLRRLAVISAVVLAVEASLYSAVAPLLPHYVDTLDLGTTAAGLLTGAYTGGMVVGAVTGGALTGRQGSRRTVVQGFALLAASSIVFGLAEQIVLLDAARLTQGFAAGLVWAGLLSWLIAAAPQERRGQVIGTAIGAATFGTIFGPVLGTGAAAVGPAIAFAVVAAAAVAMAALVLRLPPPPARVDEGPIPWRPLLADRWLVGFFALNLIPGLFAGAVNALIPLRLDHAGASSVVVGATFLAAALAAAVLSPLTGRRGDRVGEPALIVRGLLVGIVLLVPLALLDGIAAVALFTVLAMGLAVPLFTVPGLSLLSRLLQVAGVAVGPTAAIINIAFAGGETVGAALSAGLAEVTTDAIPFLALAVAAGAAALFLRLRPPAPSLTTERTT